MDATTIVGVSCLGLGGLLLTIGFVANWLLSRSH